MRLNKIYFAFLCFSFAANATVTMHLVGRVKAISNGHLVLETPKGQTVRVRMNRIPTEERARLTKAVGSKQLMHIALVPDEFGQ